jgi:stage II sporulation protein D
MMHLFILVGILITNVLAQQPTATTITLGLFTTRTIHGLTITPLGANAWQQACVACQHTPLLAPMHFEHLDHSIRFGGNFRIQADGDAPPIEAAGVYTVAPNSDGLRVTLQLSSERYVAAVLSAEAAPNEPPTSLEALAIVARTFAMANLHRHKADNFDLCDSTHCQALHLGPIRPAISQAVRNTAGISLWAGPHLARSYYTQHCGGISETAAVLWPNEHASHLTPHTDPYCLRRSPAAWQTNVPLNDLYQIASEQGWHLPMPITSIRIKQRTASGRAKLLEISSSARTATISSSSLHFAINRALGWNRIRSDLYTVVVTDNALHFTGHGYGHGVGLCQTGAFQMALEHHTTAEILAFYFPDARLGLTPSGGLWHEETIGAVTLRTTTSEPELTQAVKLEWQRALTLLPLAGETTRPIILLAPTTELFRQLTASPGYLLAVTRGNQITLQPLPILKHNGPIERLLLHELLHTLIESQSTDKAPLWLREGLAEALADIHSAYATPTSSLANIEQRLANPPSLSESRQAHRDAAAVVRSLGHTYSVAVMRQWLRDGVPTQVQETLRNYESLEGKGE